MHAVNYVLMFFTLCLVVTGFALVCALIYMSFDDFLRPPRTRFDPVPPDLMPERAAEAKARTLLIRLLNPDQAYEYKTTGLFNVPLPDGTKARLGTGLIWWPDGHNQCVRPSCVEEHYLPPTDTIIAQLVHLRIDPNGLRKIGGYPPIVMGRP